MLVFCDIQPKRNYKTRNKKNSFYPLAHVNQKAIHIYCSCLVTGQYGWEFQNTWQ